jgi:hypothetical protein
MALTIAQFQAQYTADATAYGNAVTTLINAMIALESDARTLANLSKGASTPTAFGADVLNQLDDMGRHIGHATAANRNTHPSLTRKIEDAIQAQVRTNIANWSGT